MTDKQIIIHGVDVSRCKKYKHEIERCNTLLKNLCFGSALDCTHEKSKNCYYKKLKRKEQECEELKEINQELLKYRKHSTTCQECYEDGLEDGKTSNKELRKLRKTLTEIKEIINEFAKEDILTFPDFSKEKNYELIQKQCGEPILKILQKINEVENEN